MDRSGGNRRITLPALGQHVNRLVSSGLLGLLLVVYLLAAYLTVVIVAVLFVARQPGWKLSLWLPDLLAPPWLVWLLFAGIALTVWPVGRWLHRRVNDLVYGQYDNPYALFTQLNQQLEGDNAPTALLSTVAVTLAATLNLPYVAIATTPEAAGPETIYGTPPVQAEIATIPLTYRGATLGCLRVSARYPHEDLAPADLRLLANLARQVGIALYAAQMTADLQQSRTRLVTAREEERRRIRRDLHDGLGPTLASFAMRLEQARESLPPEATESNALLTALTADAQTTIMDIRRLVYELRPPDLDEYGLVLALHEYLHRVAPKGTTITLHAPKALPTLPAAVEVAAYRIVQEAVNNAVKHARASVITVTLALPQASNAPLSLAVEICDNGIGLSADHPVGIGLHSMRERAEELGGSSLISNHNDGGVQVTAHLPIV